MEDNFEVNCRDEVASKELRSNFWLWINTLVRVKKCVHKTVKAYTSLEDWIGPLW